MTRKILSVLYSPSPPSRSIPAWSAFFGSVWYFVSGVMLLFGGLARLGRSATVA